MNLSKLFELQRKLDERIVKDKGLEGQDLLDKKILSLQVELGELANELPEEFKFWANKKNNYEKALKEYVDGLHFILSIGLEMGFDYINFEKEIEEYNKSGVTFKDKTVTAQFNNMFHFIAMLDDYRGRGNYREMTICFIRLGEMLGFTWEQIEQAYISKNEINHMRQANGY